MSLRLIPALIAPLLFFQGTFEGKLRMRSIELSLDEPGLQEKWLDVPTATAATREDADIDNAELQIKNNVVRLQNGDDAGFGLLDFARHTMTVVEPSARIYMEVPLPTGSNQPAGAAKPAGAAVKPLGKTKTLNGVTVTGYEVRSEDQIMRAWMTKDLPGLTGTFRSFASRMKSDDDPEDAAVAELMKYGFPVLIITLTDQSVRYEEMVSVERTSLSADLFKVPAGFTKQALPGGP